MKWRVGLYACFLSLAVALFWRVSAYPAFNADLFSLLPEATQDVTIKAASAHIQKAISRHLLIVIKGKDRAPVRAQVTQTAQELARSQLFEQVRWQINDHALSQMIQSLSVYGPVVYSDEILALFDTKAQAQLNHRVARQLFSPMAMSVDGDDAFGFLTQSISDRQMQGLHIQLDEGLMALPVQQGYAYFIDVLTPEHYFDFDWQLNAFKHLQTERQAIEDAGHEVFLTGTLMFAASARVQTEKEIQLISAISFVSVGLILWFGLRRWQDVLWYLSAVAVSGVSALSLSLIVFGEIHLVTLIFGTVLIGIAGDYAIHWLFHQREATNAEQDRHLHHALLLAMLTTLAAFASMLFTPFATFQQVAFFCSAGLVGAYLFVRWGFPAAHLHLHEAQTPPRWCQWLLRQQDDLPVGAKLVSSYRRLWLLVGLTLLFSVPGWLMLQVNDDVRSLQKSDQGLLDEQQQIQSMLGRQANNQFFVVRAENESKLLKKEQQLTTQLRELKSRQVLTGWQAISDWVRPIDTQHAIHRQVAQAISSNGSLSLVLAELGFNLAEQNELFADLTKAKTFDVASFLATPLGNSYQGLWIDTEALQAESKHVASVVSLEGIRDLSALAAIAIDDVVFVDTSSQISQRFAEFRTHASLYVVLAFVAVLLLLAWRKGGRVSAQLWLPSALALAITLAVLGYLQLPFNLFASVGLLLVLGIGFDFALFLSETPVAVHRLRAVWYSAVTNLLSFGLLSLSSLPAVKVFGITVLVGVSGALLFSPSVWWWKKHD